MIKCIPSIGVVSHDAIEVQKIFLKRYAYRFVEVFAILLLLFFTVVQSRAMADEERKYVKTTCIPELNYFEITSIMSYTPLSPDVLKKYNLIRPKNYSCDLFSGSKKISMVLSDVPHGSGQCGGQDTSIIEIFENGKLIFTGNGFLDYCFKETPHIIVYDGGAIQECSGYDRICKTMKIK